jgi:deferrochelatase/peroxidase EfeB
MRWFRTASRIPRVRYLTKNWQAGAKRFRACDSWITWRQAVSQNEAKVTAQATEGDGMLHRLFGRVGRESHSGLAAQGALNLEDIQGFVLRGYRMPMVRHFLLEVGVAAEARKVLARFVSGDELNAPQITTAENWHVGFEAGPGDDRADTPRFKPDYCLNLGITWSGLIALGLKEHVPTLSFKSFNAFTMGAAARAGLVGDVGKGDPKNWTGEFGTGNDHILVTLHAIDPEAMTHYGERLAGIFVEKGAFREVWRRDGTALTETTNGEPVFTSKVHFGYTDGISKTTIRGGPERYTPDHQQPCEPWLFVLREEAENYFVPEPKELGLNGSFAVFKMIETDVDGFENFLQSKKDKIEPELLAAKMCGRWRNGVPLALSPDNDSPPGGITAEQINDFEYVNADGTGDSEGVRCPVGAHIRRINPRGQPVTGQGHNGGSNNTHRLIRRGMPYGPAYDPAKPHDSVERGLLGYFINSNIENQYEFVLSQWVNGSEFAGAVRLDPKSKDPMIGTQDPSESIFVIPQANGAPLKITGLTSFISTKAAGYCFLPKHHSHQVHRQSGKRTANRSTSWLKLDAVRRTFHAASDEMVRIHQ